ncbi:conjugal transfer protein TraG N-terminal domain-containing protein [Thiotrichales bacterium 19S9-12]|nr:conjugal transfer protein TraG N-terminal domain-containing protein [Thiotrichales bacterium 19S9-11]MCF6812521.1 conjugal transfer protein TraG N-terminal domain-containing protein [Thiotrichales bacterium 19S9-12]
MLEIYTPMAGDLAEEALNSLVLLVGSSTFHSAINIAMTLGVGGAAYQFITGKKIESMLRYIVMSFSILFILIGLKTPVAIIDMQRPMDTHSVSDVPIGVALPAAFVSQVGRGISQVFEDTFHMPDDMGYNQTGMLYGSRIALASSSADFGSTPSLDADLSNYIRQCIIVAKLKVTHQLSADDLIKSPNLMTELFNDPSVVYHVVLHDVGNVSCKDAATHLKDQINDAAEKEAQKFSNSFDSGDKARFESNLSNAQNYFLGVSQSGTSLLTQNMLINKVRNSISDTMAFSGDAANVINFVNTSSMNNLRIAEVNTFLMAGYRLPMLNACLWILMMCLFPIIILLSFFPFFYKAYMTFIGTMIWLWSWPPMFSIIHFFVSFYASVKTNIFGQQEGGITLSNLHPTAMIHSDMAFTAGFLAMAIPFISKGLVSGMANAFASASQLLGSVTQSAVHGAANAAAAGNISVGQFSGWNANYDNVNAHKHDLNSTDYRGMSSHQESNGSIITTSSNGGHVINATPALSNLAVDVQGSQTTSQMLTESARQAKHRGDALRASADQSYQSAFRAADNFNLSDSNDYRSGNSLSVSDTYGINQDFRKMKELIHAWNISHDSNNQVNLSELLKAEASGGFKIFGTGANVGVGANAGHDHSQASAIRDFLNSQEGESFNQSYSHALMTAKNNHLDGEDNHGLSKAEQIAVDLTKAESLSNQASTEYLESDNYAKAASLTQSNSQTINTNFNSAFVQWAVANKGEQALDVLSATSGEKLKTQMTWGKEFLSSDQGKELISKEAENQVRNIEMDINSDRYHKDSEQLSSDADIIGGYQKSKELFDEQTKNKLNYVSKREIEEVKNLQRREKQQSLMQQNNIISAEVLDQTKSGQDKINHGLQDNQFKSKEEFKNGVALSDLSALKESAKGMISE